MLRTPVIVNHPGRLAPRRLAERLARVGGAVEVQNLLQRRISVKSIYKLIIGLSLTALPALCGSFTINSTNATNTWYGFQWFQAGSAGTCGSSPTYPCGTIFGQT